MKKKKILHIVEAFGGGIFSFLVDLINNTDDEFEIVVAYAKREQTPDNFKDYFSNKIKFIEVKNFTRSISLKKDLKAFFEIKKIIKEENPDVIHLHSSKAGFIGRFAAKGKNVKMLYNPHGFSFLMKDCSKIKRLLYWIIEKIGAFRKCLIVGCSKGEYKEAIKLTSKTICINNGVNLEKLTEETKEITLKKVNTKELKVCTVGRIGYQKNPSLFNSIAEGLPEIDFTWIGDGELREQLTSRNVNITGWKSRKEVLKLLNESDIFILTSLWEGLPISLLEAMYMKKICVVSNSIGNRDVIQHKRNGFIANNKDEFVQAIKDIKENKYDLNQIIEQQLSDLNKEYNVDVMVSKYVKKYNK